jgi:hypothetical protein
MSDPIQVRHPTLQRLLGLWSARRRDGLLPRLSDLPELRSPLFAPHVAVIEVTERPLRFRYRIVGAELKRLSGMPLEGRFVDEVRNPIFRQLALAAYRKVVTGKRPTCTRFRFGFNLLRGRYERLMLPFGTDGAFVTHVVAAFQPRFETAPTNQPGSLVEELN